MASTPQKPELLVIVGPTASGKSALAMKIAQEYNGEIVCADSRTIYKGMDIGTAKPSQKDQELVPHWGLDLIELDQSFSAAQFKDYAVTKIDEVQARGRLPILVGGTGLYVDSVLFDFSFVKTNKLRRFIYSSWSIEKLQKSIQQRDWPLPENPRNKRHLINSLARAGKMGSKQPYPAAGTLLIGLLPSDETLRQRINVRANQIFRAGMIGETKSLLEKYGEKKLTRAGGIVYRFSIGLSRGEFTEDEAKDLFKKADWQYARRQKTWFKRNKFIQWYETQEEAFTSVSVLLNK